MIGCDDKLDLVVILDSSGSIRDNNPEDGSYDNWQLVKDFVTSLTTLYDIGQVGSSVTSVL